MFIAVSSLGCSQSNTQGGASYSSGLATSTSLRALSDTEKAQLCSSSIAHAMAAAAASSATSKRYGCVISSYFQARGELAMCEQLATECVNRPAVDAGIRADAGTETTASQSACVASVGRLPAQCTATVGDFETCYNEALATGSSVPTTCSAYAQAQASDAGASAFASSPRCQQFQAQCSVATAPAP